MVYVPAVEAARFTVPVVALMLNPAGVLVNVPPVAPVMAGTGLAPLRQKVEVAYANAADGSGVTVTVTFAVEIPEHVPAVASTE